MLLDPYSYKMKDFEDELYETLEKQDAAKIEEIIMKLRCNSVGFKNVSNQIDCIQTIVTDRVLEHLKQKHSEGLSELMRNQKPYVDIKKKLNLRSEQLCDVWILYIKSC